MIFRQVIPKRVKPPWSRTSLENLLEGALRIVFVAILFLCR